MIENDVNVSSTSIQKRIHVVVVIVVQERPRDDPTRRPRNPKTRASQTSSRRHDGSSSSTRTPRVAHTTRERNKRRVNHTHLVGSPFAIVDRRILRDAPRKDGRDAMFNREDAHTQDTHMHTVYSYTTGLLPHIIRTQVLCIHDFHIRTFGFPYAQTVSIE